MIQISDLNDKAVLITGASTGIGAGVCMARGVGRAVAVFGRLDGLTNDAGGMVK